ncbi:hypothetical protein [Ramlibacter sp.]|uniref:hypothetical protein n=1 Tax=Ramlibacter sp. TaxID=1917967 RepID=UPI0035ADB875
MGIVEALREEKQRLIQAMELLRQERVAIDKRVAEIKTQLDAIEAYDQARLGVQAPKKRASEPRERIKLSDINEVISSSPQGLSRSEILKTMGAKGDASKERSISNSLSYMKKSGALTHVDGIYRTQKKA